MSIRQLHRPGALAAAVALFLVAAALAPIRPPVGVSGTVLDSGTLQPIPDAHVTLQATTVATRSKPNGTYNLPGATGADLVIVAAKKGYFNGSATVSSPAAGVDILLDPVPQSDDPNYHFLDPLSCGSCHPLQYQQWVDSPMSKAGTNTWVYDIYDGTGSAGGMGGFVYTRDSVHAGAHPESECASCHQPEPWVDEPFKAIDPIGALSDGALHGVSCEVCHKIADVDESKTNFPGLWPGAVTVTRPADPWNETQVQYGLLADSDFELEGLMRSSYQPQLDAAVCATCHQDKNDPDGDLDFEEPNGVISEPTYGEWLDSPYGDPASAQYASCVDCHMPSFGATQVCQTGGYVAPVRDPATIRSHRIEGTTPEFLENAVELTVDARQLGGVLEVDVAIFNDQTGHSVPTGVTVRNMILLVEAWRTSDGLALEHVGSQMVHDLGGVGDPAQGYYAGLPGKLYAKHNHDATGAGPTFFTDATGIVFDNRIPALGVDETTYLFDVPQGSGALHVRARLIYRRAFRFLVDAKQWTTDGHGNPLEDVQAPYFGHLMEEVEQDLPGTGSVTAFGGGCGGLVAGSVNEPTLGSSDFTLTVGGADPFGPASLLVGTSHTDWLGLPLPLDLVSYGAPGCKLFVSGDWVYAAPPTDGSGATSLTVPIGSAPALAGVTVFAQWLAADAAVPMGFGFSDALAVWVQP